MSPLSPCGTCGGGMSLIHCGMVSSARQAGHWSPGSLQQVGEVACGWKWEWPVREALEVKASLLMHVFWHETGMDLTVASIKLCWEPAPRALYHQRGKVAPLPTSELYGYCCGQVVDLSPVMPAAQFWVKEEGGAYLCIVRALVFEGSVLAYNPTMNEAEWVPVHGLANDLTWAEERSAVALANYVPHVPAEAAQITRLGACQIVSCPDDSSTSEEEEAWHPELQTTDTEPKWEEESEDGAGQTDLEEEVEPNG